MEIVSEQVKMVLERMDTHPDEFVKHTPSLWTQSKWQDILNTGSFNLVEKFLLKRKYKQIKRIATQQAIIHTIISGSPKEDFITAHSTTSRFSKAVTISAKDIDDNYIRF